MIIPKTFRINRTTYTVVRPDRGRHLGRIVYATNTVYVSKRRPSSGAALTPKAQAHAFWHEVIHGILMDMGHPLEHNERFVDDFAKRLNDVVHSAEL